MKRLVMLGGGHAHVFVLQALAREPLPGVETVLVTPFDRQVYSGMVPGVVAGHYAVDEAVIPLPPLVRQARVRHLATSAVGPMFSSHGRPCRQPARSGTPAQNGTRPVASELGRTTARSKAAAFMARTSRQNAPRPDERGVSTTSSNQSQPASSGLR